MKVFSAIFFVFFMFIDGYLFHISKLQPSEAIVFFGLYSFVSLVIYFSSEIQEFSIAGNIIKIREVRRDADKAIAELQASRLTMFIFLLEASKKLHGGFNEASPKDERVDDFTFLYENIEKAGLTEALATKITGCAQVLMKAQIYACTNYSNVNCDRSYTPDELTLEALRNERKCTVNNNSEDDYGKLILEAISHYRTLYDIFQKTSRIESCVSTDILQN